MLFDRISRTLDDLGEVGGHTSSSSACTDAGENFAKELRRSVRFLFLSNRFLRVVADWGRQEQYLTVLWEGSSLSSAFFGEEKKPISIRERRPPRSCDNVGVTLNQMCCLPKGRSRRQPGGCSFP